MAKDKNKSTGQLYTFKNVSVTLGDLKPTLAAITLYLKENGIPTARLVVDTHKPEALTNISEKASLDFILGQHNTLQHLTSSKDKQANVSITAISESGEKHALSLQNWVITSAGIVSASGSGGFKAHVEIQHPLCLADYSGMGLGNATTITKLTESDTLTGINIIEVIKNAVDIISNKPSSDETLEAICTGDEGAIQTMPDLFKRRAKEAAAALDDGLVWGQQLPGQGGCSYSTWPGQQCLGEKSAAIFKQVLAAYILNTSDVSLWELLVERICPHWSLSITPHYWKDAMPIAPFTPWGDPVISVAGTDTSSVVLPAAEAVPIMGTYCTARGAISKDNYTSFVNNGEEWFGFDGVPYIPSENLKGRMIRVEGPDWFKAAKIVWTAKDGEKSSPANSDNAEAPGYSVFLTVSEDADGKVYTLGSSTFKGILYRQAKQAFLARFKAQSRITLATKLLLQSEESGIEKNMIVPGVVYSFADKLDFYATTVEHVIDCQRGQAMTQIAGGYTRPAGGFSGIVENGTCNPLYTE